MSQALELDAISSGYGEAMIVRELSLSVAPGEILAVLGKNGMGKTTLLKTIMGFLPLRSGKVRVGGEDVTGLPTHRLARHSISYTPQDQALFQDLTVDQNLRLVLPAKGAVESELARLATWFPVLQTRLGQQAGTLSGGEQKMLLMARAFLGDPALLLIDEISEGLQPTMVKAVGDVLRAERARRPVAMLLVEQNVAFASEIADRYVVLNRGEIVLSGTFADSGARASIAEELSV